MIIIITIIMPAARVPLNPSLLVPISNHNWPVLLTASNDHIFIIILIKYCAYHDYYATFYRIHYVSRRHSLRCKSTIILIDREGKFSSRKQHIVIKKVVPFSDPLHVELLIKVLFIWGGWSINMAFSPIWL